MDKEEARNILDQEMELLQAKSYSELAALIDSVQMMERTGPSGTSYQIEVLVLWDHPRKPNEVIRVIAAIDDGGLFSSFKPMTADFLIDPDGNLVGE